MTRRLRRWTLMLGLVVFGLALAIQLVPYGWHHPNPSVTADAPWPSDAARRVAVTSCYDADDAIDTIESGSMPPRRYTILHRDARLSSDEKVLLMQALQVIDDQRDGGGKETTTSGAAASQPDGCSPGCSPKIRDFSWS